MVWDDIYCAVCSCPFGTEDRLPEDGDEYPLGRDSRDRDGRYVYDHLDPNIITPDQIAWLGTLRGVGFNDESMRGFITGEGHQEKLGEVRTSPGDDENFPASTLDETGTRRFGTYFRTYPTDLKYVYPVHAQCLTILEKVLHAKDASAGRAPSPLDASRLYEAMAFLKPEGFSCNLYINHFEYPDLKQTDDGSVHRGAEPYFTDPLDVPLLDLLETTLPTAMDRVDSLVSSHDTPLLQLCPELVILIADRLEGRDVARLTQTCRKLRHTLDDRYWRTRLLNDMPYLWELADLPREKAVGWQKLYGRMMVQSYPGKWDVDWWESREGWV